MKSGYQTSEFWMTIIAAILPIVNRIFKLDIPVTEMASALAVITAYIASRVFVKKANGGTPSTPST